MRNRRVWRRMGAYGKRHVPGQPWGGYPPHAAAVRWGGVTPSLGKFLCCCYAWGVQPPCCCCGGGWYPSGPGEACCCSACSLGAAAVCMVPLQASSARAAVRGGTPLSQNPNCCCCVAWYPLCNILEGMSPYILLYMFWYPQASLTAFQACCSLFF